MALVTSVVAHRQLDELHSKSVAQIMSDENHLARVHARGLCRGGMRTAAAALKPDT